MQYYLVEDDNWVSFIFCLRQNIAILKSYINYILNPLIVHLELKL